MDSWVDLTIDLPSDTGEDVGTSDTFPSLGHLVSLYIYKDHFNDEKVV